jgi:hypothetical protein
MVKIEKLTLSIIALCACFIVSCSLDRAYYARYPNPVDAIQKSYGEPDRIDTLRDGSERMIYYMRDPLNKHVYPAEAGFGNRDMDRGSLQRYFIIKDGKVIGGGIR